MSDKLYQEEPEDGVSEDNGSPEGLYVLDNKDDGILPDTPEDGVVEESK